MPIAEGSKPSVFHLFKGNTDVGGLEDLVRREGRKRVPLVMLTTANNSSGGQPVSMKNVRGVSSVCRANGIPLLVQSLPRRQ